MVSTIFFCLLLSIINKFKYESINSNVFESCGEIEDFGNLFGEMTIIIPRE